MGQPTSFDSSQWRHSLTLSLRTWTLQESRISMPSVQSGTAWCWRGSSLQPHPETHSLLLPPPLCAASPDPTECGCLVWVLPSRPSPLDLRFV
uniref:Uncharacterized protein n=1 Tax=Capra hircus TaxID=9925 RepID=A0A8C2P5J0_CAPHI